jgi:hypothetical protein
MMKISSKRTRNTWNSWTKNMRRVSQRRERRRGTDGLGKKKDKEL